jgi:GNAT superfamily N-acetyltransferase
MATHGVQLFKRHGYALPWLVLKKSVASFMTFETLVLFESTLDARALQGASDRPGVTVIHIDDRQSPVFDRLCETYPDKDFRERIAVPGRECYVALREGDVAGYAWVSTDAMHVDEIACVLPIAADEVFIYDCFVDEACRGAGIYPAMLRAALAGCAAMPGVSRAVIGAVSVNKASLRGIMKAGFCELKRIHYLQCGGIQHWWGLEPRATRASAM